MVQMQKVRVIILNTIKCYDIRLFAEMNTEKNLVFCCCIVLQIYET